MKVKSSYILNLISKMMLYLEWDVKLWSLTIIGSGTVWPQLTSHKPSFTCRLLLPYFSPCLLYLPSHKPSPPFGQYQIILLGDRGTCVCVNNLPRVITWKWTGDVLLWRQTPNHYTTTEEECAPGPGPLRGSSSPTLDLEAGDGKPN